jgi:hypothetical protein
VQNFAATQQPAARLRHPKEEAGIFFLFAGNYYLAVQEIIRTPDFVVLY